jgi:hypothetical protein
MMYCRLRGFAVAYTVHTVLLLGMDMPTGNRKRRSDLVIYVGFTRKEHHSKKMGSSYYCSGQM